MTVPCRTAGIPRSPGVVPVSPGPPCAQGGLQGQPQGSVSTGDPPRTDTATPRAPVGAVTPPCLSPGVPIPADPHPGDLPWVPNTPRGRDPAPWGHPTAPPTPVTLAGSWGPSPSWGPHCHLGVGRGWRNPGGGHRHDAGRDPQPLARPRSGGGRQQFRGGGDRRGEQERSAAHALAHLHVHTLPSARSGALRRTGVHTRSRARSPAPACAHVQAPLLPPAHTFAHACARSHRALARPQQCAQPVARSGLHTLPESSGTNVSRPG